MNHRHVLAAAALCCAGFVCEAADFPVPVLTEGAGASPCKSVACVPVEYVSLPSGVLARLQSLNSHYVAYTVKPDRLLEPFRIQAGLPKKADRYDGWEDGELSGHAMGHYLSALAYVYRITKDEQAKKQAEYVVSEIAKMQAADPDGYAMPIPKNTFLQLRDNIVRSQPFNLNGIWSPFYTYHKVMAGLRDVYHAMDCPEALEAERRLADFVISVVSPLTHDNNQRMLSCEFGGMGEVLADLTADTGDKKYLECAIRHFYHEALMDPLSRGQDILTGRHGNTMIPEMVGMGRIYELTGEKKYRDIADFFYDRVVNFRSFATGGHGDGEYFFPVGDDASHLTAHTSESCNCYNMLKLAKLVFEWKPDAAVMDFVERVTLNHVSSVIRPDREGAYSYFQPLGSVSVKNFSTSEHVWTCCVGTGMENPGRYGEMVAAGKQGELYVNQFWPADVSLDGLQWLTVTGKYPPPNGIKYRIDMTPRKRLSISGGFPYDPGVNIAVCADEEYPAEFTLKIRKPYWADKMAVEIRGELIEKEPGEDGYIAIRRTWKGRENVRVLFEDYKLRMEPLTDKPDSPVCFMAGPLVLAGIVPANGLKPDVRAVRPDGLTYETPPVIVADSDEEILSAFFAMDSGPTPTRFRSRKVIVPSEGGVMEFRPLRGLLDEHYAVYFSRFSKAEWDAESSDVVSRVRLEMGNSRRLVDEIKPGYQQSEIDHKVVTGNTQARAGMDGRRFRFAPAGTSFEYTVSKLPSGEPLTLNVTMAGRNTALKIVCGGKEIFSEDVNTERGQSVEKSIPIPSEAIAADGTAKLVFSGANGKASPQITGIRVMRAK